MANLNYTVVRTRDLAGIRERRVFGYTGPNPYVTGGDPCTASDMLLGTVENVDDFLITDGTSVRLMTYNYTTGKFLAIVPNTNVQVANGVDLSAFTGRFEAMGT